MKIFKSAVSRAGTAKGQGNVTKECTSNQPTNHHVDIFRLQSCQPLPPEINALHVHQDPAGHLKPRHHLKKKYINRKGKERTENLKSKLWHRMVYPRKTPKCAFSDI